MLAAERFTYCMLHVAHHEILKNAELREQPMLLALPRETLEEELPDAGYIRLELPEAWELRGGYNGRSGRSVDATRPRNRRDSTALAAALTYLLTGGLLAVAVARR